MEMLVVRLITF